MNSWKFHGQCGFSLTTAICKYFRVTNYSVIYRIVKDIKGNVITLYDGKKYELTLKQIE